MKHCVLVSNIFVEFGFGVAVVERCVGLPKCKLIGGGLRHLHTF